MAFSGMANLIRDFTLTVLLEQEEQEKEEEQQKQSRSHKLNWDSLHQSLLMLLDSPLNQAGYLQVYIKLTNSRYIKTHPEIRIPRTLKRFEQLFNNFLDGCDMPVVQTKQGPARLMQFVAKATFEKQLQPSSNVNIKFKILNLAPKLKSLDYFTQALEDQHIKRIVIHLQFGPVDFNVLGCGREQVYDVKIINKYPNEETFSISQYPLSASLTCVKLTTAFEKALEVF